MSRFPRFPHDFTWGTATSAYQIEGGYNADGKGLSIWDDFCAQKGRVANNDTGDRACDHYNRVEEDVALMKDMGVQAYRFSIAWTRILPNGRIDKINQGGLDFYNHLIDTLLANDIEPWATLYHWDLPLELEQEAEGWVGEEISDLFADYANVCFTQFGDRVKNWITLNEPWVVAVLGYGKGVFAPGIESNHKPYLAAHNLLLAHAKAVDVYRRHHQAEQAGQIGITNNCDWREPLTDKKEDQQAAERALEFFLGWFADPIYLGDYPQSMRERVGERLPEFTEQQRKLLLGSSDFFGLNHYTTMYAADCPDETPEIHVYGNGGLSEDQGVALTVDPDWAMTDMQWAIVPWGCRKLLQWIDQRYGSPEIYITENGCAYDEHPHSDKEGEKAQTGENALVNRESQVNDQRRIEFFAAYLDECANAVSAGVNLKGYFAWSLLDNFEWVLGYSQRFGLHHVDFESGQRTPKNSAIWFRELVRSNTDKKLDVQNVLNTGPM